MPVLAQRHRVVAVDVPGFGGSAPAGDGFALDAVADALLDGLRQARVPEPFDLVGHSMGGALAIALADRHRDAVARLVLVAPAGLRAFPARAARAAGVVQPRLIALRRTGAPLAAHPLGRRLLMAGAVSDGAGLDADDVRTMVRASRGAARIGPALVEIASADLRPTLAHLPHPLGVLWGERDHVVPATGVGVVRAARPDVLTETIPGTGHIAMMERPGAFAAALQRLLAALTSAGDRQPVPAALPPRPSP